MGTATTLEKGHTLSAFRRLPWVAGIKEDYEALFVRQWSPYLGGTLLVLIAAALMASGLFWGVFGGVKLWGDYLNQAIGLGGVLGIRPELDSPLLHRISLMNITLVIGALTAALLSRQFRINRAPPIEYVWGALGGTLMGIGATLAGGCTVGGFFTPIMFGSAAGWAMAVGLTLGAIVGLKLLLWTMEHVTWGTRAPSRRTEPSLRRYYPLFGLVLVIGILLWATRWFGSPDKQVASRAIIVLAGFAFGFVLHRSRFCFSRVFREPFMTAEGDVTKAMMTTLAVGMVLGSVLLMRKTVDPYTAIPASFWIGSLLGGAIFGIGMVFAGGCASGSLWRVGEGHLKLVVAVFFFGWAGSTFTGILKPFGVLKADISLDFLDGMAEITKLGYQAYLPDLLGGWGWTYALGFALLAVWYLLIRYNESTERFTIL